MKTILVATDFSEASQNAAAYGVQLARAFNARLILFNAYMVPAPVSDSPVLITRDEMQVAIQSRLEECRKQLDAGYEVNIITDSREGATVHTILDAATQIKADLVIAGMKKTGRGMRRILGSTVTALARKSTIPVLVVPADAQYAPISAIALANEDDLPPDADNRILTSLQEIAERFHSKVYLVRIAENRFKEAFELMNAPFKLTRILRTLDPIYQSIEGHDVPVALDDFAASYKVSILALLPHKHSLMERWFGKSTTRDMIFESHLPLLILPDMHRQPSTSPVSEEEFNA